jgi:uncharacterized protein YjbI with pentapeptide repeats
MELEGDSHTERVFEERDFRGVHVHGAAFTDCVFRRCNLAGARLVGCRFQSVSFEECDLSLIDVTDSLFAEVRIADTKAIGVEWAAARWADVSLGDPLAFERCVLNDSTFLGLALGGLRVTDCTARLVDFREADLSGADFSGTDLTGSLFAATDLRRADFRTARNYRIPPAENRIEKARFSLPEALSLLHVLGIELDD